jgi:glycosyltransferase involved in cell wall biosynthesis
MSIDVIDRPHLSFVVPGYNEAENIAETIAEIEAAARDAGIARFEIVVVDDCSKDQTAVIVAALAREKSHLKLVRNKQNLGFGGAYKEGVRNATGTYVIMVPGDNAHPKGSILPILAQAGTADIIIPYVTNPGTRSRRRQLLSRCFTGILNLLFGIQIPYFNGTVLHKTDLLRSIEINTNGFAYQAEALVKLIKRGATFASVGVQIDESRKKRTTAFKPKNVYRVVNTIFTLWRDVRHTPPTTHTASQA